LNLLVMRDVRTPSASHISVIGVQPAIKLVMRTLKAHLS
jgi:hypothetical protein